MNEQMHELINQCFISTTDGKLSELNTVANIEKFARLIVRECADIAQQHNKSPVAAPLAVGYVIREYFGLE